jgi:hypothetical protein
MGPWGRKYTKTPECIAAHDRIAKHGKLLWHDLDFYRVWVEALRSYMDGKQPNTKYRLVHGKRNLNGYNTFWGVIIFEALSVFLAFISLAFSIAQAVASFIALNPPIIATNTSLSN